MSHDCDVTWHLGVAVLRDIIISRDITELCIMMSHDIVI